jgi:tetratricopeptide (TPR) repeat protein
VLDGSGTLEPEDLDVKDRADRALHAGNAGEALSLYSTLLRKVAVLESGIYDSWLDGAAAAYLALGRTRQAGCVLLSLRRFSDAEKCFDPSAFPQEWALCATAQARPREAARALMGAGHPVLAALALEKAGDWSDARDTWNVVASDPRLQSQPYEAALVHFNLGRVLRQMGDPEACRREWALTQSMLEELADSFETQGERERAFDCYTILLGLGKQTGSFENVAEGYVNAIRLLSGTAYRYETALEYYEDFLEFAAGSREWHAAAMLAEEAADFSLRLGLAYERHYRQRSASLWNEAARHNIQSGGVAGDLRERADRGH